MALPWKEVIQKPEYQSLPQAQKIEAQEQYYNEVVAPKAGNYASEAKEQFYAQYPIQQPSINQNNPPEINSRAYFDIFDVINGEKGIVPTWEKILNLPEFKKIPPEKKAYLQEFYFNKVIAPKARDNEFKVKSEFYQRYPAPSEKEQMRSIIEGDSYKPRFYLSDYVSLDISEVVFILIVGLVAFKVRRFFKKRAKSKS